MEKMTKSCSWFVKASLPDKVVQRTPAPLPVQMPMPDIEEVKRPRARIFKRLWSPGIDSKE
jgi:hypothetical protein